jgi:hypothetical protein
MRADTQTISIQSPADAVFAFVADPANLSRWAIGFAKDVRADADVWLVTTGDGEQVSLRPVTDEALGVVDFHMVMPGGVESVAWSRVVPRGEGSEFVFRRPAGPRPEASVEPLPGDQINVASLLGVLDGHLQEVVGLVPGRCPPVELGHHHGLALHQLGVQQLAEHVKARSTGRDRGVRHAAHSRRDVAMRPWSRWARRRPGGTGSRYPVR